MSLIDKIQYPTTALDRRLYEAVFDNILGDTSRIPDEALTNLLLQNPEIKCRGCGETFTRDLIYDNPLEEIILFMKRPENFYYTCRWLFNIELVPFQLMILQELWSKKFPMLLMTRGGSKCESADSFIVTDNGFSRIGDFVGRVVRPATDNVQLLGEKSWNNVKFYWYNGFSDTKKITTRFGYTKEGTGNHPIRVIRNNEIVWKDLSEVLVGDRVAIDRSTTWFKNTNDIDEDTAYLFGLLVGDGGYTVRGTIGFTTCDDFLAQEVCRISQKIFNKTFRQQKRKMQWNLHGVDIWDSLFNKYGFNSSVCGEKDFPKCVLSAKRESVAAFIRGLMDTDGSVRKERGTITFSSKSKNLVHTLQFVLTRFGIISRVCGRLNKQYNRTYYYLSMAGRSAKMYMQEIGFGLQRKKDVFVSTLINNDNIDTIPHCLVLDDMLLLRKKFTNTHKIIHGIRNNEFRRMSKYRLKSYEITYNKLKEFLDLTVRLSLEPEWQRLSDIYNRHLFFDTVVSCEDGYTDTYDVEVDGDHSFLAGGFISHNSFLLSLYAMLRAIFETDCKVILAGAAFRQSKLVFEYMENIWRKSPILRSAIGTGRGEGPKRDIDRCNFFIFGSEVIAIPIGSGEKIRGLRSNYTICDEAAAILQNPEVFEVVIRGFSSVSKSPDLSIANRSRVDILRQLGMDQAADDAAESSGFGNQIVISGTAYYTFNRLYDYYKRYNAIIESQGDQNKLEEIFLGAVPDGFDWTQYSVITIPFDMLPKGFMDEDLIAQARATFHTASYLMEYKTVFVGDSSGFFKRSLIESCVCNKPINLPSGPVTFQAVTCGNPNKKYIMGVDPASETDNFSVVVLEIHEDHRRIVYAWSITREKLRERLAKRGNVGQKSFYSYCARKIRDISKMFPCEHIGIDGQGGGIAIMEALHDPDELQPGELPIWPYIKQGDNDVYWWEEAKKPTDNEVGLHTLHVVQFVNPKFTSDANHGLRKDFESKITLFPHFDTASIGMACEADKAHDREYDTLEDCVMEIESLKDELTTIIHEQTITGRDRWDTPAIKKAGNKVGRLRKDRYTALTIANLLARVSVATVLQGFQYKPIGGYVSSSSIVKKDGPSGSLYIGPDHIISKMAGTYGIGVRR